MSASLKLPWESNTSGENSEVSQILMQNILELSMSDLNFTVAPDKGLVDIVNFNFDESIPLAMTLLSMDQNLARVVCIPDN